MSGAHKEIFHNFLLNPEMAVGTDLGKHFPDSLNGEPNFDYEFSSLYAPQASDDGILSIQVLEFKTSLLEAAEELLIRRDAAMRFEDQINKFMVEKQELEWEKEALQRQNDTLVHQHNHSLSAQKKQFQARIAEIEGEKGKHQLSAELKDREIGRLKEEVKLLQLFKYSLQKKLSELEQKLQLQLQAKDSRLSQLGEVERRFAALSRQSATVKQAHETLVQNVEEALRLNKKLMTVNKQQETTINRLKQDVEKANNEMIKSKVSSACKPEGDISHLTVKGQQMQQLQHRLNMETEMNKQLMKENAALMTDRQEAMSSLLQVQQLLQSQTGALARAEQELSTQREENQALKREHKLFQEKIREKEGRIESLMEDHNRTIAEWRNEEKILQEKLNADQEELKSMKEAYGFLQQKHKQFSFRTEHTQEGERDLTEPEKNSGNPETCVDHARCGHADPAELQKQEPPACEEMEVNGPARDDGGGGSAPGEPGETASSEGPQADRRPTAVLQPRRRPRGPAAAATVAHSVTAPQESAPSRLQPRDGEPANVSSPSALVEQDGGFNRQPDNVSSPSALVEQDGGFNRQPDNVSSPSALVEQDGGFNRQPDNVSSPSALVEQDGGFNRQPDNVSPPSANVEQDGGFNRQPDNVSSPSAHVEQDGGFNRQPDNVSPPSALVEQDGGFNHQPDNVSPPSALVEQDGGFNRQPANSSPPSALVEQDGGFNRQPDNVSPPSALVEQDGGFNRQPDNSSPPSAHVEQDGGFNRQPDNSSPPSANVEQDGGFNRQPDNVSPSSALVEQDGGFNRQPDNVSPPSAHVEQDGGFNHQPDNVSPPSANVEQDGGFNRQSDNVSPPSIKAVQDGGFNEPAEAEGTPADSTGCDPVGGGREGRKQRETAAQAADKHGGSLASAGCQSAAAFQPGFSQGHPGFPETSHSGSPQRPAGPTSGANESDINPIASVDRQTAVETDDSQLTQLRLANSCPDDPPSTFDSDREQKEAKESEERERWNIAEDDVCVDNEAPGLARSPACGMHPSAQPSGGSAAEPDSTAASDPQSADGAGERVEGRRSFQRREGNVAVAGRPLVVSPRAAGAEPLGAEEALPGSGGLVPGSGGLVPGSGGLVPGSGGLVPGSGGLVPGSGGLVPGSGGLVPGSGGLVPGSGGLVPGSGGLVPGSGGLVPGSGGLVPGSGGLVPGSGGLVPGSGGLVPGSGGLVPGSGGLVPGSGGLVPGSGGLVPGSGGLVPGSGGLVPVSGGLVPVSGGLVPGSGGLVPGSGGLVPGSGGLVPGSGGLVPGSGGLVPGSGGLVPGSGGLVPGSGGLVPGSGGLVPGSGGLVPGSGGLAPCGRDGGAPGNKRFRSSFDLELLMRDRGALAPRGFLGLLSPRNGDQTIGHVSRSLTPARPSFLKTKPQLWPGVQAFLSLQKDTPASGDSPAIKMAADMLNASSIHPRHRRDPGEEWNAIARTFGQTSAGLNTQTERPHVPGCSFGWDFLAHSSGSAGAPPASIPARQPPPPASGPGFQGNGHISENERLAHPRKRKVEAEEHEVHTSTNER